MSIVDPEFKASEDEPCECGHIFNDHILVAYKEPLEGGLILCPEDGCKCASTWAVEGMETGANTVLPPEHVIDQYRKLLE